MRLSELLELVEGSYCVGAEAAYGWLMYKEAFGRIYNSSECPKDLMNRKVVTVYSVSEPSKADKVSFFEPGLRILVEGMEVGDL